MNKRQRSLMVIAVALIVVTGILPPWKRVLGRQGSESYSPIWRPPELSQVDVTRLGIEWILICLVAAVIWLFLRKEDRKEE